MRKLKTFPTYLEQVTAVLRAAIAAGMVPSKSMLREMVARAAFTAPGKRFDFSTEVTNSIAYRPFASLEGLDLADSLRIQEQAREVIRGRVLPALKKYTAFVESEYFPACSKSEGLSSWPMGGEIYRHIVQRETGTSLEPGQIHETGIREVGRIRAQIGLVATTLKYEGSVDGFLTAVNADKQHYFSGEDELLAAYRAAIARIQPLLPKIVRKLPPADLRIVPVRHGGAAAAYHYEAGAIVVEVSRLDLRPKFEVLALAMHEGVPGHHLERRLAAEPKSTAEAMMRRSAFMEGWALYAESLGDELGLYGDAYDKVGQLSMELMRAVRLVVDTGVHGHGGTVEQAKKYFLAQTGKSEAMADLELMRLVWPGNVLVYKVGALRIQAMRERAARTLGPKFDVRGFHDALIRWSPLPLDILERKLDECLSDASCTELVN